MKISIFSAFYPFRGGIAQFNASLYRALEKKQTVKAFTFKKQYPNFLFPGTSQFVNDNDEVDRIEAERIVSTFNPFTYLSAAKKIKNSKPDVFVTNYWMSFFGFFMGLFASKQTRATKKIAIVHNLIPHEKRFFDTWLNKFFVKRYDGFIVMSKKVGEDVLSINPEAKIIQMNHPWYNHFGSKISKIEAIDKLGIDPSKKTLLFFGLIRDYKGLDLLIDAFSLLDESYQLIIAGEVYSNLEKVEKQIKNSTGADRIYFFNQYIPDSEVKNYFSAADVCVLPYRTATQSGITATSFYFEVPIIATNVGGLKESIRDEELGLITKEVTPNSIYDSIQHFFETGIKEKLQSNILLEKEINSWDYFAERLISFAVELDSKVK